MSLPAPAALVRSAAEASSPPAVDESELEMIAALLQDWERRKVRMRVDGAARVRVLARLREVQDDSSMEARLLQREADALAFRVGREKQWLATHKRELRRIQGRLRELSALT